MQRFPILPMIPPIKIEEPYDYPTRWLIPSKSEGGASYLVDLAALEGHGECQCRWCQTSYAPILKRGQIPTRACSHIIDARRKFAVWAVKRFDQFDKNKKEEQ
jgi:hypothetical protein